MGKGWSIFLGAGSGLLEIAVINFTSRILFDLLFRCRLKDHLLFFTYAFSVSCFIKSFLNSVLFY